MEGAVTHRRLDDVRDWLHLRRWRIAGAASLVILVAAALWIPLLLMGIFRGVAVVEPCDEKARAQFGYVDGAWAVRGDEYVQLFPPAWVCPLANGESVTLHPWG